MNPIKNHIKVKCTVPKEVVTAGGIIIPIKESREFGGVKTYNAQKYAPTHGEVVAVGDDCGIKVGDIAMFHYGTEETCKNFGKLERDGDDSYFYLEADRVVCIMRDGKLKPINGWVLARHCEKPKEKTDSGLYIPEVAQKKSDRKFVVVAVPDNYDEVLVGQIIYTEKDCDRPIQSNEYFGIADQDLFKIEIEHILAVELV